MDLEGGTTKEAIEAERVAAFEAAESARLQVPLSLSVAHAPAAPAETAFWLVRGPLFEAWGPIGPHKTLNDLKDPTRLQMTPQDPTRPAWPYKTLRDPQRP